MFSALEASLFAAVVTLVGVTATALVMKGNNDNRYMTRTECETERKLQCAERAAVRENLDSMKRTLGIALHMCRALVSYSDIPDAKKEEILNNTGGYK